MIRRALLVCVAAASTARAQTAVIGGTVVRDTLGHAVAGAEVALPGLDRRARTNFAGEFRFDRLPAGRHAIVIRHFGFAVFTDSVTVRDGQQVDADFVLTEQPVTLDSQRVVAAPASTVPATLREFEARRTSATGGHFFTTDELRKIEGGRPLMNYLANRLPGMLLYRPDPKNRPSEYYLGGQRGPGRCPVALYIDGAAFYVPGVTRDQPPDISGFSADDFAAAEYYASGASLPPQYNTTQANCGVLLLWRRYR